MSNKNNTMTAKDLRQVSAGQRVVSAGVKIMTYAFLIVMALIVLFLLFIWRGYVIAMRAPDTFSALLVFGIISQVGIQAFLNIGVVTDVLPNTGIALPFFSYGGTALAVNLGEMGVVLSISRQRNQTKQQEERL